MREDPGNRGLAVAGREGTKLLFCCTVGVEDSVRTVVLLLSMPFPNDSESWVVPWARDMMQINGLLGKIMLSFRIASDSRPYGCFFTPNEGPRIIKKFK